MHRPTQLGFTLIELLMVTLILTIILTIALPRFWNFQVRSGRTEAKAQLSALAKAEFAYYGVNDGFTDDLSLLDWSLDGEPRYLYGFTSDNSSSAVNDTAELRASGLGKFGTRKMVGRFGILLTEGDLPTAEVLNDSFHIGAAGNLDSDATLDRWTLDRNGTLTNVTDELTL